MSADDAAELGHVYELLGMFWEDTDSLLWSPANQPGPFMTYGGLPGRGPVRFMVNCSDTFYWACADAEDVDLPGDLESLRTAAAEFPDEDWPLLWVCRKRAMQPMPLYMKKLHPEDVPFRRALEAAGPTPESS